MKKVNLPFLFISLMSLLLFGATYVNGALALDQKLLLQHVEAGNFIEFKEIAEKLMHEEEFNPNKQYSKGNTLLHIAINNSLFTSLIDDLKLGTLANQLKVKLKLGTFQNYIAIIDYLIKLNNIDLTVKNNDGDFLLAASTEIFFNKRFMNESELIDEFIEEASKESQQIRDQLDIYIGGEKVFSQLVKREYKKIVHKLVNQYKNEEEDKIGLNFSSIEGNPLEIVTRQNSEEFVKLFLSCNAIKKETLSKAIYYSSKKGYEVITQLLLDHPKTDPNQKNFQFQNYPIYVAVENKHLKIVELFLADERVNPNIADKGESTALHTAARRGNQSITKALLDTKNSKCQEIDPNKRGFLERVALHFAVLIRNPAIVKLLLDDERVDPNIVDQDQESPLHMAVLEGHQGVFQLLLAHTKINPNQADKLGQTPLHLAVEREDVMMVRALLNHDNFEPVSIPSLLALVDEAKQKGSETIVALLDNYREKYILPAYPTPDTPSQGDVEKEPSPELPSTSPPLTGDHHHDRETSRTPTNQTASPTTPPRTSHNLLSIVSDIRVIVALFLLLTATGGIYALIQQQSKLPKKSNRKKRIDFQIKSMLVRQVN